jgi:hypothetical protein
MLAQLQGKVGGASMDLGPVRELCRKARLADMVAFLDCLDWLEKQQLERDTMLSKAAVYVRCDPDWVQWRVLLQG